MASHKNFDKDKHKAAKQAVRYEEQVTALEIEIEQLRAAREKKKKAKPIETDEEYIAKNKELDKLRSKLAKAEKVSKSKNIWILKPGENTNRGIGITVHT